MAKRDPEKTTRNRIIREMSFELKEMLPKVLKDTGIESESSLHGLIGHKNEFFIDVRNDVIHSQDEYVSMWLSGLIKNIEDIPKYFRDEANSKYRIYLLIKNKKSFRNYLYQFLKRTYIRNLEALSRVRPKQEDSEIWIGQNNADYGILITPRFNGVNWENDKSEIRHFPKNYWTIGHILAVGLVVPFKKDRFEFSSIYDYLNFFKNVIVRNSGSVYEMEIADKYSEFVLQHHHPEEIPLLIPEYRYNGLLKEHKYRLDFTIIEGQNLNKFGFEISPWSTHGLIKGTKNKTQKSINKEASDNFEKEISKLRNYFKKFDIYTLIYSDTSLLDLDSIFDDMKKYLEPKGAGKQMKFHIFEDILSSSL